MRFGGNDAVPDDGFVMVLLARGSGSGGIAANGMGGMGTNVFSSTRVRGRDIRKDLLGIPVEEGLEIYLMAIVSTPICIVPQRSKAGN